MKRTPLFEEHTKLNARFTDFNGWEMPVQYTSIIDEHTAVRTHAGLFDTSHMGVFTVTGAGSAGFLNHLTTANIPAVAPGKAKYALFLNERGGIIDDLIIYRREDGFLLVVNAGNREKDLSWLMRHAPEDVNIADRSDGTCLLALQGPDAEKILQPLAKDDLSKIPYFGFKTPAFIPLRPAFSLIARTGYTGEDGFEIFISPEAAPPLWEKLLSLGAKPCGLGCRDTLRLEACMPLHGHEINDDITPLEADLGWAVYWDKEFIGRTALLAQKQKGISCFLIGFIMESGIPRAHHDISHNREVIGSVTSGTFSPALKKGIGLGYVREPMETGNKIEIIIHNHIKQATVVPRPFYKRTKIR